MIVKVSFESTVSYGKKSETSTGSIRIHVISKTHAKELFERWVKMGYGGIRDEKGLFHPIDGDSVIKFKSAEEIDA